MNSEEDVLLCDLVHVGGDFGLEERVRQPQEVYQVLRKWNWLAPIVGQSGVPPVLAEVHAHFECLCREKKNRSRLTTFDFNDQSRNYSADFSKNWEQHLQIFIQPLELIKTLERNKIVRDFSEGF